MKRIKRRQIELSGDESHLILALKIVLLEEGYILRPPADSNGSVDGEKQPLPDFTLAVTTGSVTLTRCDLFRSVDLARPVDIDTLLLFLREPSIWQKEDHPKTRVSSLLSGPNLGNRAAEVLPPREDFVGEATGCK